MNSVFVKEDVDELLERINKLTPSSKALWGTMNVAQMLAHCNVTYELVYDNKHPKPTGLRKIMLKYLVKPYVVNNKPYKQNSPTGPQFIVDSDKNFEMEKKRLIDYIIKTMELGAEHFNGKESHSFGALSKEEWNKMFYKHLDHHLSQFGV